MSLDNVQVIDAIGTEIEGGAVVLTIIDSWDWIDEQAHLKGLQSKLNAYFNFVESGQIYTEYPDAIGKLLRIDVVGKFPVSEAGHTLLEMASKSAAQLDMVVSHRTE